MLIPVIILLNPMFFYENISSISILTIVIISIVVAAFLSSSLVSSIKTLRINFETMEDFKTHYNLKKINENQLDKLRVEIARLRKIEVDIEKKKNTYEIVFDTFLDRMNSESSRILRSSIINLTLGMSFSLLALFILSAPLFENLNATNVKADDVFSLVERYAPRLAVGVLTQLVGFFFLRLYVTNEMDIKHTKNEITNFEYRMVALNFAKLYVFPSLSPLVEKSGEPTELKSGDVGAKGEANIVISNDQIAMIKEICMSLINIERNFIIKKDERSIHVENDGKYNDLISLLDQGMKTRFGAKEDKPAG
jgi:hypothetical protein